MARNSIKIAKRKKCAVNGRTALSLYENKSAIFFYGAHLKTSFIFQLARGKLNFNTCSQGS